MKLYLIRHGQTDENAHSIVQGWLDTQLNATGHQQAKEAARQFNKEVDAIYSSDLYRAIQSSSYFIEKYPDVPYIQDGRLKERYLGESQGKPKEGEDWSQRVAGEELPDMLGAESLAEFSERINAFLTDIKQQSYQAVLIVSHGGTIARLLQLLGQKEISTIDNATVLTVVI